MAKNKSNKTIWISASIVALIVVIIGGIFTYNYLANPATVLVSASQSNIEVKKGQQFIITLDSNATTGYSWAVDDTYDKTILTKISSEYTASTSNLVGAGGTEKWTFKAQNTGTTQLNFRYIRAWEGNSSQADSKTFTVTVK